MKVPTKSLERRSILFKEILGLALVVIPCVTALIQLLTEVTKAKDSKHKNSKKSKKNNRR